jgi:WD40 repeat protein
VIGGDASGPQLLLFDTSDLTKPTQSIALKASAEKVAIAPSGQFVATVGDVAGGRQLSVIRVADGVPLQLADEASGGSITSVAFHPAEATLLTGSENTSVTEWQLNDATGTLSSSASGDELHRHPISAVGYSADGQLAFSADEGGDINVWRRDSDRRLRWPYRHAKVASGSPRITAVALSDSSSDVKSLAYGCADGSVYLLRSKLVPPDIVQDVHPEFVSEKPDKLSDVHQGQVTGLVFAKGGDVLISSGADTIHVHDATPVKVEVVAGKEASKPIRRYHASTVLSCSAGGGDYAYSSDRDGRVLRWKIDVPAEPIAFGPAPTSGGSEVTAIDYFPNDTPRVAVADRGGFTHVWADNGRQLLLDQLYVGHDNHRRMEAWVIPGVEPKIVTVAGDHRACLWDVATGLLERAIELGPRPVVAISANNRQLLAATDLEGTDARAFSLTEAGDQPLWTNEPRVSAIQSLRASDDSSSVIAVGLRDGQLFLWSPERGHVPFTPSANRPHWRPIRGLAFDSSADVVFAADSDGQITRWTIADGQAVADARIKPLSGDPVLRLVVSHDGSQLLAVISRAGSRQLKLLDAKTLADVDPQPPQLADLVDAAFAPDGTSLLAVTSGSTIEHWTSGQSDWQQSQWSSNVYAARRRSESISGVRCDREGNVLVFGDGFVQLWDGANDNAKLVSRIRSRPTTQLVAFRDDTPEEIRLLSSGGRLDLWARSGDQQYQPEGRIPPALRGVIRACRAVTDGHAYLAIRGTRDQSTQIELWNLDAGEKVASVGEPFRGACDALVSGPNRVAYAASDRAGARVGTIDLASGETSTIDLKLPTGQRAVDLALAPDGERLVVCTSGGACYVASAAENGTWNLDAIDREDISAAAFSPHGDRLILGTGTGQVLIVKLQPGEAGVSARLLLTLPGHSDRITALQFANREEKLALLSGDAAGRVLLHPLE